MIDSADPRPPFTRRPDPAEYGLAPDEVDEPPRRWSGARSLIVVLFTLLGIIAGLFAVYFAIYDLKPGYLSLARMGEGTRLLFYLGLICLLALMTFAGMGLGVALLVAFEAYESRAARATPRGKRAAEYRSRLDLYRLYERLSDCTEQQILDERAARLRRLGRAERMRPISLITIVCAAAVLLYITSVMWSARGNAFSFRAFPVFVLFAFMVALFLNGIVKGLRLLREAGRIRRDLQSIDRIHAFLKWRRGAGPKPQPAECPGPIPD